jgi:RNA polymerase sigma factor (sigma-70 family)
MKHLPRKPPRTTPESVQKNRLGGGGRRAVVASWDEFYRRVSGELREMARKTRLSAEDIEDAIHETWLAALRNLPRFLGNDPERHMNAWMRAVMHHKIADVIRRRSLLSLEDLAMEPSAFIIAVDRSEQRAWVEARLADMAVEASLNARLLCGHFCDGRTIAELAAESEMTQRAVESRICRQIEKLRQEAAKDGFQAKVRLKKNGENLPK